MNSNLHCTSFNKNAFHSLKWTNKLYWSKTIWIHFIAVTRELYFGTSLDITFRILINCWSCFVASANAMPRIFNFRNREHFTHSFFPSLSFSKVCEHISYEYTRAVFKFIAHLRAHMLWTLPKLTYEVLWPVSEWSYIANLHSAERGSIQFRCPFESMNQINSANNFLCGVINEWSPPNQLYIYIYFAVKFRSWRTTRIYSNTLGKGYHETKNTSTMKCQSLDT